MLRAGVALVRRQPVPPRRLGIVLRDAAPANPSAALIWCRRLLPGSVPFRMTSDSGYSPVNSPYNFSGKQSGIIIWGKGSSSTFLDSIRESRLITFRGNTVPEYLTPQCPENISLGEDNGTAGHPSFATVPQPKHFPTAHAAAAESPPLGPCLCRGI